MRSFGLGLQKQAPGTGVDFDEIAPSIFDALHEMVVVTDDSFVTQTVNQYTCDTTGYTQSDLANEPLKKLFDSEQFDPLLINIRAQLAGNDVARLSDTNILTKDGQKLPVIVSVATLADTTTKYVFVCTGTQTLKELYGSAQNQNSELEALNKKFQQQQSAMLNLLEDSRELSEQLQQEKADVEKKVTERTLQLNAEHARLEASVGSLDAGFIILDKDLHPLLANAAYSTLVGSRGEVDDAEFERLNTLLKDTYDLVGAIKDCLAKGDSVVKDDIILNDKHLSLFIAPIFDQTAARESLGVVMLLEDISEREALQRTRDEFFSIASHELRTPLTAIRGNSSMILEYYQEQLGDPTLHEMVDDIFDSSTRLITIVNDFLDMSRLEQNKIVFELTSFDAVELAHEVQREFVAGKVNCELYLRVVAPDNQLPAVFADRDRLKQAVINLVSNAIKFTEKGGVSISFKQHNTSLQIVVSDTGKGIPTDSQDLLFRKFQQASNNILTRDSTRSTGLGLYISRLIVEGMSGKIYLESSELDKGSTFVVEIPVAD